jgi:GNAT superfamily N-acetyltransferase
MSSSAWTRVPVIRTHLELRTLATLRATSAPERGVTLHHRSPIGAPEYRDLYALVGSRWLWRDRLVWTDEELDTYLAARNVHVWTMHVDGQVAGYFELQHHPNDAVEVMYFGLAEPYIGRGLGGWMLTRAVEESFALGGTRVILNTCTLDAPQALPNYLARGFTITREERYSVEVPAATAAAAAPLERSTEAAVEGVVEDR